MMCGAHGLKELEDGSLSRPCAVEGCGKLIPAEGKRNILLICLGIYGSFGCSEKLPMLQTTMEDHFAN